MICNQAAERWGVAAWARLGSLAPVRGGVGAISAQRSVAVCKKLTRPDGEIRAGRFDRRRGSGGRERRSGLLNSFTCGLDGPFRY
jgi:hypothetical protein